MLSILIPIYNHKVVKLVGQLRDQCIKEKISFEIICLDDKSTDNLKKINREIDGWMGINYVELSENIGRSKIRNQLARLARFPHSIFIDSDSAIISKSYIKKYINAIHKTPHDITYGGTAYAKKLPQNADKRLHWKYGKIKESPASKKRKRRPGELFHSNNFLTPTDLIKSIPFDQEIEGYGYEDLELASRILSAGVTIHHIDNPVMHKGLKTSSRFLSDTFHALENLAVMYLDNKIKHSRLIDTYHILNRLGLTNLVLKILSRYEDQFMQKLTLDNPSLIFLDLLKLYYFGKVLKNKIL